MNPSRIFILRPVGTTLLMVAMLLVGVVAYRFLPVSALPEVDYPTIQVTTFYPGASPEVMTTAVTAPLERQFGEMPGLTQMSSISSAGASVTTLQFALDLSLDVAEQEVQAAINAATGLLPAGLPAPPVYAKINPANAPVLTLAAMSKTLPLTEVEDLADVRIAQKISQVSGVGLVSIAGGQRPALRVKLNPRALAAYGLAIDDIRTDITNQNTDLPKGNFDGPSQNSTINNNDQLQTRGRLPKFGRGLQKRRRRSSFRRGDGRTGAGEHRARRLGEPNSRDHPQHSAPAGDQRHRSRRRGEGGAAETPADASGRRRPDDRVRPDRHDSRLGDGCRARPRARSRARRHGNLRLSPQSAGDAHSEPLGPVVAHRHSRRNVPVRLLARQSFPHVADHRERLRRRRRHCDDREHRPIHRARR